jgi:hypothetical protein
MTTTAKLIGRSVSFNLNRSVRTYKEKYKVTTTDPSNDWDTITATSGLPTPGTTTYAVDDGALCTEYDGQQTEFPGSKEYVITYTYSSEPPITAMRAADPTARPPIVSIDYTKNKVPLILDLENIPVLNSAGQGFSNLVNVEESAMIITIVVNYASVSLAALDALRNSVNTSTWAPSCISPLSVAAYGGRMDGLTYKPLEEDGIPYLQVTYRVAVAPGSMGGVWNPLLVLDSGYNGLVDGELVAFTDGSGQQLSLPSLLNGDGQQLEQSDITNIAIASDVATITTSAPHGLPTTFDETAYATITGLTHTELNGQWLVTSVPSTTTLTFAITHANVASASDSGNLSLAVYDEFTAYKEQSWSSVP